MVTPEAVRFELIEANGHSFEVATCGQGDRLALCLHGFPEHALSWQNQLPLLAGLGYRAWAPNQRGYGKSFRPRGVSEYRIEKLMEDVAGLIDVSGARQTVLIAHDWGAVVAWSFAARQIRPLDALIIMNVPHPQCYLNRLLRSSQIFRSWYIYFFQLPRIPEWLLTRRHAALVERAILRSSSSPEKFPRDLLQIFRDNASTPGAHDCHAELVPGAVARRRRSPASPGIPRDQHPHAHDLGRKRRRPVQGNYL